MDTYPKKKMRRRSRCLRIIICISMCVSEGERGRESMCTYLQILHNVSHSLSVDVQIKLLFVHEGKLQMRIRAVIFHLEFDFHLW